MKMLFISSKLTGTHILLNQPQNVKLRMGRRIWRRSLNRETASKFFVLFYSLYDYIVFLDICTTHMYRQQQDTANFNVPFKIQFPYSLGEGEKETNTLCFNCFTCAFQVLLRDIAFTYSMDLTPLLFYQCSNSVLPDTHKLFDCGETMEGLSTVVICE